MRLTLRTKFAVIAAIAAVTLAIVAISSTLAANDVTTRLSSIRERYIPKIDLRPRLEADFERLRRGFQDAVAAQDTAGLDATRATRDRLFARLTEARRAVDSRLAEELRRAVDDYYATALDVSRRLIAEETGEDLLERMTSMQSKQERVVALIDRTTALREEEVDGAFSDAERAQRTAIRVLLWTTFVAVVLATLLSWTLGRSVLRSVADLRAGFARFGQGAFEPIRIAGRDELADVATSANEMARSLENLEREREATQWLESGHAGLAQELRGELSLAEVGARAVRFLARYVDAPVGALYHAENDATLRLLAHHAASIEDGEGAPASRFPLGEGLVGHAALDQRTMIVESPPEGYLRVRSGLGESPPRAIVLVPLRSNARTVGVIELAVFRPWPAQATRLLELVRETLAIALEVAAARETTARLLESTQVQAQRLAEQEEELRSTNEELQAQQEELRQTNEELVGQTRQLEEARRVLEQKAAELAMVSAYKSQFLANMSHELRTPLNSMLLLSSLLAENQAANLTTKQVEHCKTIHSAGLDLLALINQVLDLARIEAGKQDLHVESVPLADLVAQLRGIFEPLALEKDLRFSVELDGSLPASISTDRQRVAQILNNLLGNAIKFTERGQVTLRVHAPAHDTRYRRSDLRPGHALAFSVEDTGVGISREDQERIFEPFEQADPSTDRRFGGTGLGLAIAREIATLLGGEIDLRSVPGSGSRFVLHLPFEHPSARAAEPVASAREIAMGAAQSAPSPTNGTSLLLIEDDPVFADSLCGLVRGQGLTCTVARDGETGLRLARETRPAGIVLDLVLPDINGWAVLAKLQTDPATASIPVHVVSALDAAGRAGSMGTVGYLRKPASKDELLRMIASLVPARAERSLRVLVVEDDVTTGDSLVALLTREGIEAHRVGSASAASRSLEADRFPCMVVDLSLPDMDGLSFLKSLDGRIDRPSVIVYTARSLSKAEVQRLEEYARAVVLKEGPSLERVLDEIKLFARTLSPERPGPRGTRAAPIIDPSLRDKAVLLVDDDMRTVYALSAMLRSRGIEVHVADTGLAALSTLHEHPDVDGVLMDIMMPEMDGYEAMRRIRADARWKALPIVALTAKAMKGDEEKCLEAGASAYLAKPIDPDRLFAMLASLLGGSAHDA